MSGAFLSLFLAGMKLSMPSFIGLIMLIGIVVNNAILLVEFIGQNRETMGRDEAIAEAGSTRMRPILMTTLTTIISMVPMALGIGEGTGLRGSDGGFRHGRSYRFHSPLSLSYLYCMRLWMILRRRGAADVWQRRRSDFTERLAWLAKRNARKEKKER